MEAEDPMGRGCPGIEPRGCPYKINIPLAAREKERGMADGEAVNIKWEGTGCAGMSICPLPEICPTAPRPTQIL